MKKSRAKVFFYVFALIFICVLIYFFVFYLVLVIFALYVIDIFSMTRMKMKYNILVVAEIFLVFFL